MIRSVITGGKTARLRVEGGRVTYEREGQAAVEGEFSIATTAPGVYSVQLNGRVYRVGVGTREVLVNGKRLEIEVFDPRDHRTNTAGGAAGGLRKITAPMPGKIVRILVKAGDLVEEGQGLIVVEAMKMQNEMKSPQAGTVKEVRVADGATVAAGDVLLVVE